ncbi:MAG: hypothetical protein KKG59_06855 [Nanoarchaeota archaeon]|nr:hypothetical protein [Nanoarchaeota archaeon]
MRKAIILLVLATFLLSSCGSFGPSGGGSEDEYTGTDGVNLRLMPGTPPSKVYFFSNPYSDEDNFFPLTVEIHNKGASVAQGGLYISGYDPGFISIEGVNVQEEDRKWWDCDLDVTWLENAAAGWFAGGSCVLFDGLVVAGGGNRKEFDWSIGADLGKIIGYATNNDYEENKLLKVLDGLDVHFVRNDGPGPNRMGIDFSGGGVTLSRFDMARTAVWYLNYMYGGMIQDGWINEAHGRQFVLWGDSNSFPGGEQDYQTFNAEIMNWPHGLEQTEQAFLFTSCYLYTTYASPQVCIDPFPESSDRKVCSPRTITYSKGQAGPVAITKIEQENTPRTIFFTIHVENKGKGRVYRMESLNKCDPLVADRVTAKDLNQVFVGYIGLAQDFLIGADAGPMSDRAHFRCQPDTRLIRLDDKGKGTIVCEYRIPYVMKSAYLSPLVVSLWYGYSDTIMKKVTIKRAN